MKTGIYKGHPYTDVDQHYNGKESKDYYLLSDLPWNDRGEVLNWICKNIRPRKSANYGRSSYGLKHILQNDTGIYVTNNQFKDAMLILGYYPIDENELNWQYKISDTIGKRGSGK